MIKTEKTNSQEMTIIATAGLQLQNIELNGQRLLTTAQLAESYGTESKIISKNFERNKERYKEGKHYYCLKNDELKVFLANVNLTNANKIRTLYLWTEKGAFTNTYWTQKGKKFIYDLLAEERIFPVSMQEQMKMLSFAETAETAT